MGDALSVPFIVSCRNVNSFLLYFILFFLPHVRTAEESANGELCNKVRYIYVSTCTSSSFFENQPDEICSRLSEKASEKAGFLSPTSSKRKRRKRKSEEERRRREKAILLS